MVKNIKSYYLYPLLFILFLVIYYFSSEGNTPYNHFTLLADSFLKGKLYIEALAPWLEKIPIDATRFYVANPPMPAILAIPFVFLFGKDFPQQYLAHLLGAGLVLLTMAMSYKIKNDIKLAVWSGLLTGLGTIIWFMSSNGSVWYLGQITGAFFLTWSILEMLGKKRPLLMGILLGCTYLARNNIAIAFPLIVFMDWKKFKEIKNMAVLVIAFLAIAGIDFAYNFQRFGNIFERGYNLIPGVATSSWFPKGIWHPSYFIKNINIMFLALPKILPGFPYLEPSWRGMAIWLTTPAFIYAFASSIKERVVKLFWLGLTAILLIVTMHGGTGFAQFGYRFAVDFYPFLIYLTILGVKNQGGPKWHHWMLLTIGILVNLWGVLLINKFGFVGW